MGAFAALSSSASTSRADPAAEARFHDELARKHHAAHRYEDALREFFLEQRASPNPRIAFNIALCFLDLDRAQDAFLYLDEYLRSDDADPQRRAYAERTVAQLRQRLALVRVESQPQGADIYIDRREHGSYGRTPKVVAVPAGEHTLLLERDGYRSAGGTIVARSGEEVAAGMSLTQIVGHLRIGSPVPGDAVVRTPAGETVTRAHAPLDIDLPPGSYDVSLEAPGHVVWTTAAKIEPERTTEVTATPQRMPEATGDVTVTSNIPGALVELNGEPVGFTPTVLSGVEVGTHRLRVRTPASLPWMGEVEVAPDERSWVTVSLENPPVVRRPPATWVLGGLAATALAGGAVMALLARQAHADFDSAPAGVDRTGLRERGVTLNIVADASLLTGALAAVAAVIAYFATAETTGKPSSASSTRDKR